MTVCLCFDDDNLNIGVPIETLVRFNFKTSRTEAEDRKPAEPAGDMEPSFRGGTLREGVSISGNIVQIVGTSPRSMSSVIFRSSQNPVKII
jgi:hypothetical protein